LKIKAKAQNLFDDIVRPVWRHTETVIKKAVLTPRTDFGTLKLVPNRLQQKHTDSGSTQVADVFILDPSYLSLSYLKGYRTEDLAKTGLSENKQMSVDWTLKVLTEKSMAIIGDINPATAVTL
jgi:hypothetical protein